jgi:hypothetical protein
MLLMLLAAGVAAVAGFLSARYRPAFDRRSIRLRWWLVLLMAVAGQSFLALVAPALRGLLAAADCAAVATWCVLNRRSRSGLGGLPLLGSGCVLNCVVIAANAGMPVSRWALGRSGLGRQLDVTKGHLDKHVVMTASTDLRGLGDIIPVPGFRTVMSAGDVLMLAGIAAATFTALRHLAPDRRPSTGAPATRGGLDSNPARSSATS